MVVLKVDVSAEADSKTHLFFFFLMVPPYDIDLSPKENQQMWLKGHDLKSTDHHFI